MQRWMFLLRNLFRKKHVERDLNEEVESYFDFLVAESTARGIEESEARRLAHIELGGADQIKESVREVRMGATLDVMARDVRHSLRSFARSPGFVVVATMTLALGVGANTAIFSLINTVVIKGLPFARPKQLVLIAQQIPSQERVFFSTREFVDFRRSVRALSSVSGGVGNSFTMSRDGSEPRAYFGQIVTTDLFQTLGVHARLGRTFFETEGVSGQDHVMVMSDSVWREYCGADPEVLGRSLNLNNEPYRVVGVMPPGFAFPDDRYQLWVPAALTAGFFQKFPDAHMLRVVGRVREGATRAALQEDLDNFTHRLAELDPNAKRRLYALDLQTALTGDFEKPLVILMCAVAALLLIACANVANLVLSRASFRAREFAIRAAIGATRSRLVAQVMTESLILALLGGVAGLAVGTWSVEALTRLNPARIPFIEQTRLDFRVLLFTLGISVAASCLFGLGPALSTGGSNLMDFVRQSGRGLVGGSGRRLRRSLVFAQVALATVLLIGAGVMIRSLIALESVPSGIRPEGVLTANMVLTEQSYPENAPMLAFYRRVLDEARRMPGVSDAAIATHLPFTGQDWGNGFEIEGRPAAHGEEYVAQMRPVSPHYFSTLGIPLDSGRAFAETDTPSSRPVVMINATLAKRFWPDGGAVGKRINLDGAWRTIIGVARDVKPGRLDARPEPEIYFPYVQFAPQTMKFLGRGLTLLVRSAVDAQALAPELRAAVSNADKSMAVRELHSMNDLIGGTVAQPRFRALLFGIFSALALTLAAVGIYGVIAYSVTQRVQEIGVRIALGAARGDILGMVVRDGASVAVIGIAAGVLASLALGRFVAALLFEVKPGDPATIGSVCLLLVGVALAASLLPALRAARLDPTASLRGE